MAVISNDESLSSRWKSSAVRSRPPTKVNMVRSISAVRRDGMPLSRINSATTRRAPVDAARRQESNMTAAFSASHAECV